jgi:hypothetical protein
LNRSPRPYLNDAKADPRTRWQRVHISRNLGNTPLLVVVGASETAEFLRGRANSAPHGAAQRAWKPRLNHFSIVDAFCDPTPRCSKKRGSVFAVTDDDGSSFRGTTLPPWTTRSAASLPRALRTPDRLIYLDGNS